VNLILHAVSGLLAAMQAPAVQTGPLTLDDAVAIAQRNAFAIAIQETRVERGRQAVNEARAASGPRATVSGTYTRYPSAQTAQLAEGAPPIVIQPIDNKTINASVSLPLDIAGLYRNQIRAARNNERAARFTLQSVYNDVRLNARMAFFNVLRAQASVVVQQQAVEQAEAQLRQAQLQYEEKVLARIDVTRYEAAVASARTDLVAAQNSLQLAKNNFNVALARPVETPVELVNILDLPPVNVDTDQVATRAQQSRPEVLALRATSAALADNRRVAETGDDPSLNLSLNHQRNFVASGFSSQSTTSGALTLSIPVFDSGLTRARVKEARQDEEQARLQILQTQLNISNEVRSALTNLANAQARLKNAEQQVLLAEEVYRLSIVRQNAGEGTYVEVIDAQTSLTQARTAAVNARYDYLTAYSQLQRAVGNDVIPTLPAAGAAPANGGGTQ